MKNIKLSIMIGSLIPFFYIWDIACINTPLDWIFFCAFCWYMQFIFNFKEA